jgi:hypothetical protein
LTYKSTIGILELMNKSTPYLKPLLAELSEAARRHGLSDSEWAAQSQIRKETLSRIRSRLNADFTTVEALARTVGAHLEVRCADALTLTSDGHFPTKLSRDDEERLLQLAATRVIDEQRWRSGGPQFFMAGFAVMLASLRGMNRHQLLELAEHLHPGSSHPDVFSLWLARSPLKASRFAPLLMERLQRAS